VNDATLTVAFSNNSTTATTYNWNFGDGQTSTEASPNHVYSAIGTYTVTLIANNNCGADTTTSEVTIIEVGIEELANTNNVSLVPNPANEFLK
jgi:PKD repeat protein